MNDDQRRFISSLEAQEERLVFTRFDNVDTWRLGGAMVVAATERSLQSQSLSGATAISCSMWQHPGTTAENDSWIERKVSVVNRFAAASYLVGRRLATSGTALDEALGVEPRLFAAHGGGLPDPYQRGRRGRQRHRFRPAPGR
jgi:uncharacterized protein (UPF0303 family)